jgi:hypothetical protein
VIRSDLPAPKRAPLQEGQDGFAGVPACARSAHLKEEAV